MVTLPLKLCHIPSRILSKLITWVHLLHQLSMMAMGLTIWPTILGYTSPSPLPVLYLVLSVTSTSSPALFVRLEECSTSLAS